MKIPEHLSNEASKVYAGYIVALREFKIAEGKLLALQRKEES